MARLSDVPRVFAAVGVIAFLKRVYTQLVEDNLLTWASALAYSWLFAVFPFLIFVLALVPYLPAGTKARAEKEMANLVYQTMPQAAADTVWQNIEGNLDNILHKPKGALAFIGIALAVWAASGGMAMTMSAFDKCYELEVGRPFYKQRPIALALTVGVAVLIILVVVLLPIGGLVKLWCVKQDYIDDGSLLLLAFDVARWTLALLFMVSALMLVYHFGPSVKHRFHWITPGSTFCIIVWVLLGLGFRLYVQRYGKYEQTYGAVGGVAVLLLFFYVDALVLLIGAEINSEIDFEVLKVKRGTRDFRPAEDVTEPLPVTEPVPPEVAAEAAKAAEAADLAADEEEAERIEKEAEKEKEEKAAP